MFGKFSKIAFICVTLHLSSCSVVHAAVFAAFDPVRHNRFLDNDPVSPAANPNFIVDESLIRGVGYNSRAVLISSQHYISADHAATNAPTFRGSDGILRTYTASAAPTVLTTISNTSTFASDIRLYTLDAPIPVSDGVAPLPIVGNDPGDLIGQEFLVVGQGNTMGRNIIAGTQLASFGNTAPRTSHTIRYTFDTATNGGSGGLLDEAGLIGGDSGHPALMQVGSQVAVVGTHFGIAVPGGSSAAAGDFYYSFSTYLQPYLNEIGTLVADDGLSITTVSFVTAVPEPNSFACLIVLGFGLAFRRGRRQSAVG